MVEDAELEGRIKPGDTLIEPTSGTQAKVLLLYRSQRISLHYNYARENEQGKQIALEALGAEIIRTPSEVGFDDPTSHIGVAEIKWRDRKFSHP